MMRFAVAATNPKTGEQRVLVVDADSPANAERIVLERGWAVTSVWIASPDHEPAVPEALVLTALENEAFVNARRAGACAWLAAVVMILIGLGLLPALVDRLDRMQLGIIVLLYVTSLALIAIAAYHVRRFRTWGIVVLPVITIVLALAHAFPILAMLMSEVHGGFLILFSLCVLLLVGAALQSVYALMILNRIRRRSAFGFEVQPARPAELGGHDR